ncbi:MAG: adenosylcobinamide-phosphate synthase CbiB [Pirellulales bacterium]
MTNSHLMIVVLLMAVLFDRVWGEPPSCLHPVVWMGCFIAFAKNACLQLSPGISFILGGGIVLLGICVVATVGWKFEQVSLSLLDQKSDWMIGIDVVFVLLHIFILKCCFGIRSLRQAALSVLESLEKNDNDRARHQLAYHLVSRDVDNLSANEISAATIESVAENTSDSIVAPLFFYAIAGLPGALVYRYINTCDAMLGYRTTELEWLGKAAAWTDDLLNLIPARITAGLMIIANLNSPAIAARACRTWMQDASQTASPNAGHPMSVASGALGVSLEKTNHYCLGKQFRLPKPSDISAMLSLLNRTVVLAILLACSSRWTVEILIQRSAP